MQQRLDSRTSIQPLHPARKRSWTIFWQRILCLRHSPLLSPYRFFFSVQLAEVLKADLENTVFNFAFELIHRAEWGSRHVHPSASKSAPMAGTDEAVFWFDPAQGATQVGAYGRKHLKLTAP